MLDIETARVTATREETHSGSETTSLMIGGKISAMMTKNPVHAPKVVRMTLHVTKMDVF